MAIAKNPKRMLTRTQEAFISGGAETAAPNGQGSHQPRHKKKAPIMIRIDSELLGRIDQAAKKLGISRSAFIVSSTARQLEQID